MKRFCFAALAAFCWACFAEAFPAWLTKPEKDFPAKQYIRAVGEGSSVKAAQNSALAEISLYFNTKVDVVNVAVSSASAVAKDGAETYSSSKSFKQIANVSSSSEFFCVSFTDPFYDKKADKYSVLAYINKAEASEVYKNRISSLMESINLYSESAAKEKEVFLAAAALSKAVVMGNLCEKYIHTETLMVPSESESYKADLKKIATARSERDSLKKRMTFFIDMVQKDKVFAPVYSKLSSLMEKRGYALSLSGASYTLRVDLSCAEENYDAGPFVRPSVDIAVLNAGGSGVYSYSKAFPRIGSKTMEQAYTRAVSKINQDLDENFLAE